MAKHHADNSQSETSNLRNEREECAFQKLDINNGMQHKENECSKFIIHT